MLLYGIRGATTVLANTQEQILVETQKLMQALLSENGLSICHDNDENAPRLVSIIFTSTQDLNAEFPAKAARLMGLEHVPLLGCVEADVPHGLKSCIRVLIHAYLPKGTKVKHVYLNEAVNLRPDL
jgi:chorismate mutase